MPMTAPRSRSRQQPKQLDAGMFQAEISSFALRLAAEGKAAKTIRTYTEAVQWFAAACLADHDGRTGWEQVDGQDIQRWMAWLLDRYSSAYASNQYRALHQFFKWLAAEDQLPDPMAGLAPPRVPAKLVPVFIPGELSRLEQACAGRTFAQRRDTAIIAVLTATGIRLSELAALQYDPGDPRSSDIDLWQREITVRGKGGKDRIVKIGHQAARSLDRYQVAASAAKGRRPAACQHRDRADSQQEIPAAALIAIFCRTPSIPVDPIAMNTVRIPSSAWVRSRGSSRRVGRMCSPPGSPKARRALPGSRTSAATASPRASTPRTIWLPTWPVAPITAVVIFPRCKVAASVHFVEVDELVVAALRPAARCAPRLLIGLLSWTRCLRGPVLDPALSASPPAQ
jgi:site-specific recombinase XerD